MKTASITQTKNQLSSLLDEVKRGETIVILDRNRPVARLEPIREASGEWGEGRLAELERQGLIRRAARRLGKRFWESPPPASGRGASPLAALLSDRREGR